MNSAIDVIQEALNTVMPMVQMHGGNIEFERLENDTVYVRLQGACVDCPMSLFTLKLGIEQAIKEKLPHIKEVVALAAE